MKKPKKKKKPVKMGIHYLPRKQKKAALKLLRTGIIDNTGKVIQIA